MPFPNFYAIELKMTDARFDAFWAGFRGVVTGLGESIRHAETDAEPDDDTLDPRELRHLRATLAGEVYTALCVLLEVHGELPR